MHSPAAQDDQVWHEYPLDVDQQTAILLFTKIVVDKLKKMKHEKQKNNGQSKIEKEKEKRTG